MSAGPWAPGDQATRQERRDGGFDTSELGCKHQCRDIESPLLRGAELRGDLRRLRFGLPSESGQKARLGATFAFSGFSQRAVTPLQLEALTRRIRVHRSNSPQPSKVHLQLLAAAETQKGRSRAAKPRVHRSPNSLQSQRTVAELLYSSVLCSCLLRPNQVDYPAGERGRKARRRVKIYFIGEPRRRRTPFLLAALPAASYNDQLGAANQTRKVKPDKSQETVCRKPNFDESFSVKRLCTGVNYVKEE
jgi:hypothetical protein